MCISKSCYTFCARIKVVSSATELLSGTNVTFLKKTQMG